MDGEGLRSHPTHMPGRQVGDRETHPLLPKAPLLLASLAGDLEAIVSECYTP